MALGLFIHVVPPKKLPPPPSSEPDHFCDDNPSNIITHTAKYRDHNAHNILPLTTYRHKTKNANPKKKSTGKTTFLQKSCVQENEK